MMRRAVFTGALLASALWAGAARAQQVALYFNPPDDTAHAAVPGAETRLQVRARNAYWTGSDNSGYPYILNARATFVYDATKIQVLGAEGTEDGLYTINSATAGPGTLTVNASGSAYGTDQLLYFLRVKLLPGVTDGTYLWIKGDSAQVYSYNSASGFRTPALGTIGQVCHATQSWGDVDGNGQVDSRDALITLSAAVGLPNTGGFNLTLGDVDSDGLTNSRDALLMLSYAVSLDVGNTRVGDGILDVCPGLTAPGDTVAFFRNDYPGLAVLGGTSTVPAAIPGATNATPDPVRLAADGRSVVYVCPGAGDPQICRVDADTGGVVQLTSDVGLNDKSPDWSPSGDSIVYLRNSVIWKMARDGSGQAQVGAAPIPANAVRWGRDRAKLAYANGELHVVNGDGTGDVTVTTGFFDIGGLTLSPGGDSVAFQRQSDPRLWVVPVSGGTPSVLTAFAGNVAGGDWSAPGFIFSVDFGSGAPSLWVIRGVDRPIFRVTKPSTFDRGPAWRRNP